MESKSTVLIVDDDIASLKMAGEILYKDYTVSCVKSGREALALIDSDYLPDIILLDVSMPGLDGFDTLSLLRQRSAVSEVPVIFLTGIKQPEAELKGITGGAVDYITKPFISDILLARLKVHLENGRRLRQKREQGNRFIEEKMEKFCYDLTETESKVMRLLLLGDSNQEIAEKLSYSYNYVKKVITVIYEKKGVEKRSELKKVFGI